MTATAFARAPLTASTYRLIGEITDDTATAFLGWLDRQSGPVTVELSTPGGLVDAGLSIFNALRAHPHPVTTICTGIAASMGSVLFLAGDERRMARNGLLMLHNPHLTLAGDAEALRRAAVGLDRMSDALAAIYADRTGLPVERVLDMMSVESWLTAAEAAALGFATAIEGEADLRAAASFNFAFLRLRQPLPAALALHKAPARANTAGDNMDENSIEPADESAGEAEQGRSRETIVRQAKRAAAHARWRANAIYQIADDLNVPEHAATIIASGLNLKAAKAALWDLSVDKEEKNPIRPHVRVGAAADYEAARGYRDYRPSVAGGDDWSSPEAVAGKIVGALAHRLSGGRVELPEPARELRPLPVAKLAALWLEAHGERGLARLSDHRVMARARGATFPGHTTSDFPSLLGDSINKAMLPLYARARSDLEKLCRREEVRDFKLQTRVRAGDFPALKSVPEGAEYTYGTIGESKETFTVAKYGRMFSITWEALVNDDTNALNEAAMAGAMAAATLNADLVANAITSNPNMSDGVAVFHANHANVAAIAAAPSIDSIGAGVAAMRKQKSVGGNYLNLSPAFIAVPTAIETATRQVLSPVNAVQVDKSNAPITSLGLDVIVDPRFDGSTAWYLFANPSDGSGLTIAFLSELGGAPEIETEQGFEIDGVKIKVKHVAGVAWTGAVGAFRNAGA